MRFFSSAISAGTGTRPVIDTTCSGLVPQVTIGGSFAGIEPHLAVEMRAVVGAQGFPIAHGLVPGAPLGAIGRPLR